MEERPTILRSCRRMGLPEAVSLASLYSAQRFFRSAVMPLGLLAQYSLARKLYPGSNILGEEECVTPSSSRYWDRKQRCARLFQVAREGTTVEMESPGENRCRHVSFRELLYLFGRYEPRKAIPKAGGRGKEALIY